MRYIKYSKIITLGLFSLTLSFVQCSREKVFQPYPIIKGQVTDHLTNEPIDSAMVRLWIEGLGTDTLTYFTDSIGAYSTEKINNWFHKRLTFEASKFYGKYRSPDGYVPYWKDISPDMQQGMDSTNSDTIYLNFELEKLYSKYHFVTPKKLDFLYGQYISYIFLINDYFGKLLYWEIEKNYPNWMSIIPWRIINTLPSDMHYLKVGGYVIFKVQISRLLLPGTYDSSILVITDQGNTIIPVHVVVE